MPCAIWNDLDPSEQTGARKDRLMQLWTAGRGLPPDQHRGRQSGPRPATPDRRGRSPSWRSPSSTRRSTSSASTCSAPTALVGYDYTFRRPGRPRRDRHDARHPQLVPAGRGPTRSRAARRRSCATSSASRCSACPASPASTSPSPGTRSPATDARFVSAPTPNEPRFVSAPTPNEPTPNEPALPSAARISRLSAGNLGH